MKALQKTPTTARYTLPLRSCGEYLHNAIVFTMPTGERERERERESGGMVCVRAWMVANDSQECRKVGCRHRRSRSFTLLLPPLLPSSLLPILWRTNRHEERQ